MRSRCGDLYTAVFGFTIPVPFATDRSPFSFHLNYPGYVEIATISVNNGLWRYLVTNVSITMCLPKPVHRLV
jgi:hypothetical protein